MHTVDLCVYNVCVCVYVKKFLFLKSALDPTFKLVPTILSETLFTRYDFLKCLVVLFWFILQIGFH